jgi:type IV pilus assembly protein PilB
MLLLEELVKYGILHGEQISEVIELANKKFNGNIEEALINYGIKEEKILEIKGNIFNVPIRNVDPKTIPVSVLKMIPLDAAKTYHFVPIGLNESLIEIGVVDLDNIQAKDALTFITAKLNKPFKIYLIANSVYQKILSLYENAGNEIEIVLSELDAEISNAKEKDLVLTKKNKDGSMSGEEEKLVEDAPIIKIVAVILRNATEGNASDIHIENTEENVRVRFRVDGTLFTSLVLPPHVYNGVIARIKILAKLRLDEKRKPQDGGFSAKIDGRKIDFRVSSLPTHLGEKVVLRILDPQRGVKALNDLDMSENHISLVREALASPHGLILITGPTGSGKTTTLYSMLRELDSEKENIVSLEDPVEYKMPGINQSQIMPEIGYTFASGLRSILRQDPNKIMVGEIRDKETAELAIQAAMTGHLVFSTLHTNSAVGAIPRLIDMGIDPYLIAPTLILSIAQRLAKKIHPNCRHEIPIDQATQLIFDKHFSDYPAELKSKLNLSKTIFEAVPSAESSSGILGRIPIYEMFKIDKDMQAIILKNPLEAEIYHLARSRGMVMMREDAIIKSMRGLISFQEIFTF